MNTDTKPGQKTNEAILLALAQLKRTQEARYGTGHVDEVAEVAREEDRDEEIASGDDNSQWPDEMKDACEVVHAPAMISRLMDF